MAFSSANRLKWKMSLKKPCVWQKVKSMSSFLEKQEQASLCSQKSFMKQEREKTSRLLPSTVRQFRKRSWKALFSDMWKGRLPMPIPQAGDFWKPPMKARFFLMKLRNFHPPCRRNFFMLLKISFSLPLGRRCKRRAMSASSVRRIGI